MNTHNRFEKNTYPLEPGFFVTLHLKEPWNQQTKYEGIVRFAGTYGVRLELPSRLSVFVPWLNLLGADQIVAENHVYPDPK